MTYAKDGKVQLSAGNWISLVALVASACGSVLYSVQTHMVDAEKRMAVIEANSEHTQETIRELRVDVRSLRNYVMKINGE
ncbi:MAG: hypothetical protein ABGX16_07825 [Pirellulales bacterium]